MTSPIRGASSPDVRPVVEALASYAEARIELSRALDNYDGYSPSYHFSSQIAERDQLEREAGEALATFIRQTISQSRPT